nr:restriction endonuclease subunit S [Desulfobacula sp.]
MKYEPLIKIAKITSGQGAPKKKSDFSEEGIPFVRAGSLEGLINGQSESDLELIKPETAKKYRLKLFPKGSILLQKVECPQLRIEFMCLEMMPMLSAILLF